LKIEFNLSKKTILLLATFAPALFGCLYYIMVYIPVMGNLWYVIAPFALLLYWSWVGGRYREYEMGIIPAVLLAHVYAVVFFVLYLILYFRKGMIVGTNFFDQIVFWFTYPLQFVTLLMTMFINGAKVSDSMLVFYFQLYGLIIMIIAFLVGYGLKNAAIKKEKRKEEKLKEEAQRIQSATGLFKNIKNREED